MELVIDAMDLLHGERVDGFCLVSSDSDFTGLAKRIREQGLKVFGFGEQKTPKSRFKGEGKMRAFPIVAVLVLAAAGSTAAAQRMTYDDYWKEAHQKPGIVIKEYPNATVVMDEKNFTAYFFTKPGTLAHPGVIVRKLGKRGFVTEGHSDGPDSVQPAFKAWMDNPLQ